MNRFYSYLKAYEYLYCSRIPQDFTFSRKEFNFRQRKAAPTQMKLQCEKKSKFIFFQWILCDFENLLEEI